MREQNKYTHLIERVPGLAKELASNTAKELTGMTPSACYWRLRDGKGLINMYDQESLAMWSRLLADIRRHTGSPMSLQTKYARAIKVKRLDLLEWMEDYRTWLERGAMPKYHSQLYVCTNDLWRDAITSYAVAQHLVIKGYDLCTPPEQSIWTMPAEERAELRKERRAMVREVIDTMAIDWPEVYRIAAKMAALVQQEQEKIDEEIRKLEEQAERLGVSKEDLKEINKEIDKLQNTSPLRVLSARHYAQLYDDEIWQIRTDFDARSSAGAGINGRLLWICDVPTITADHREIYNRNKAVLEEFRMWKEAKKKELEEMKKAKRVHYSDEEIAAEIIGYLRQIEIPPYIPIKKAEASLTD